jgi:hypothetical protein
MAEFKHSLPMIDDTALTYSRLIIRFKLFKGEDLVGEIERVVTPIYIGDGECECVVKIGGYVFDCFMVSIYNCEGELIDERFVKIGLAENQEMLFKFTFRRGFAFHIIFEGD